MENKKSNNTEEKKKQLNAYVKYSGLAFQMIAVMVLAVWGGMKLDRHFESKNHLFTIFLLIFAVVASMYFTIRGLLNNNEK